MNRYAFGPAPSPKSYLNMKNIIEAACLTNADAIHPGFGFLSENAKFAKICEETGIIFIGPNYNIIDKMGDKSQARDTMKECRSSYRSWFRWDFKFFRRSYGSS